METSDICQEAFRTLKEATADEMEKYITKKAEEARQQRLESRSANHKTLAGKLCVSAEGGTRMLITSLNQRHGVEVESFFVSNL